VRSRLIARFLIVVAAMAFTLAMTVLSFSQTAPAAQGTAGGGARGARGNNNDNPAVNEPTPRLPDGTVNLGRAPNDVDGNWKLPYIQNMADRALNRPQAAAGAARGGGGGRGAAAGAGQRGGAASEPWVPFLPWTAAVYNYHSKNESKYDPEGYCLPPGGPRLYATPYPMVILQQPELKRIYMNFEGGAHVWREIFMDGRPHPAKDKLQGSTWLGHSVGRWEGNTLVVDVANFNEGTWLDYYGHSHTDQMHVVERWTRPNKGTLHYEATIDDPGAYKAPWTIAWDIPWDATAIDEYICQENNQYLNHLKDDFGRFIIDHGEEYPKF
jgi:hypothetical protein